VEPKAGAVRVVVVWVVVEKVVAARVEEDGARAVVVRAPVASVILVAVPRR